MAVDQNGLAERLRRAMHEVAQHAMIGLVEPFDAPERFIHREAPTINLLPVGDDPRNRAKAAGDAHGARVDEGRQPTVEHPGIEFVRFAVDVQVSAGEARGHQGSAERQHPREEAVDEGVLRTPQGQGVETRGRQESVWVDDAGVRRVENEGGPLPTWRFVDKEWWVEFSIDRSTHQGAGVPGGRTSRISLMWRSPPRLSTAISPRPGVHAMFTM